MILEDSTTYEAPLYTNFSNTTVNDQESEMTSIVYLPTKRGILGFELQVTHV
jgi:hypothetical protein